MTKASVAIVLSVVALVGLGLVYAKLDRLEERLETARAEPRRETPSPPAPVRERPAEAALRHAPESAPERVGEEQRADEALSDEPPSTEPELEDRVRTLEKRLGKWRKRPPVADVKQLSKMLELTKTQEDRVAAAVEDGRRRVEDILKIPEAKGTSPFDRRRELQRMVGEAVRTGQWQEVLTAMKTPGPRNQRIPGRNTTYGEEIARVVSETRDEITRHLGPEQQEEFEDTRIDPLLNEDGLDPVEVVGRAKNRAFEAEADDG
jgi:hypothetical protein